MKLNIQKFGGRGASSESVSMTKGNFQILTNRDGVDKAETVKGRVFTYKGVNYGVSGSSRDGYTLTHIDSGFMPGRGYYYSMKELKADLDRINKALKDNKELVKRGIERFNKVKNK